MSQWDEEMIGECHMHTHSFHDLGSLPARVNLFSIYSSVLYNKFLGVEQ